MDYKVTVSLKVPKRRKKNFRKSHIRAVCDVVLDLSDGGAMMLRGFKVVVFDGGPPLVVPPGRQGFGLFSYAVRLEGRVKALIEKFVTDEYERASAAIRA